jgi:hypothetical protein
MSSYISSKAGLLSVIFLSALFILYFYSPVFSDPSAVILNDKGDALKNYYCYQWHVMHDESFVNYTGTNYPFGEHHFYCDGNPLLSNIIKALPFLKDASIGIYNLSLFLSFIVCAVLLYKIFRLLAIPELFSVLASIGITILGPQVFRLPGHMALSYGFAIPLTIYLLLKYEQKKNATIYALLLSVVLLCLLLIHPYLGMICTAFVFTYWIFRIIANVKALGTQLVPFLIQSVVPVLLLKLTDTHTDRVSRPYGFLYYTSSIETVFISSHPPFRHLMSQVYKIKSQSWEGLSYIGLTSVLCVLVMPFFIIRNRGLLRKQYHESSNARALVYMIASSVVLLLFSMAIPFKWNMEWLLDDLPFIQQFRAPGRYAWVFYFMTTIASVIIISKYFLTRVNEHLRMIICSSALLLYSVEGIPFHSSTSQSLFVKNPFDYNNIDEELKSITAAIRERNAQAIIPLPFFHIGTDHYNLIGSEQIQKTAFIVSYHTKLPLMAGFTPRTSLSESAMMIQAIESPAEDSPIRKYIDEGKPFIILGSKEPIREEEKGLLSKGKLILETDHYFVRELAPGEFFRKY